MDGSEDKGKDKFGGKKPNVVSSKTNKTFYNSNCTFLLPLNFSALSLSQGVTAPSKTTLSTLTFSITLKPFYNFLIVRLDAVMLSVVILSVVMLSVITLSVVILSVLTLS
jgi:hypothetical protein